MLNTVKNFLKDENGMGTVEIVIIVAVLVSIALIFKNTIYSFVTGVLEDIFGGTDPNAGMDPNSNYADPSL